MLFYCGVLTMPLLLSWSRPSASRGISIGILTYFLLLLVFVGLRNEVGPDWGNYLNIFLEYQYDELTNALAQKEPGFFALNKVSDLLGFGLEGVVFVCALVFLIGIFAYAAQTASAWIALAAVTPYLIFVIGMSGIRQAAAMGILYCLLARWTKFNFIMRVAIIGFAGTLHNSALFGLLLLLVDNRKWLGAKIAATGLLIWYLLGSETLSTKIGEYQANYVDNNLASDGAFLHVLLSALPAGLYLYNRRRITAAGWGNPLVTAGSFGAIIALPLIMVSSTGVDRLSLYFSYVQMWVYPALVVTFDKSRDKWLLIISGIVVLVFLGFFLYGNHASAYVPYRNLLID